MDNRISLLITLLVNGNRLIDVALGVDRDCLSDDCALYWAEPFARKELFRLLPLHYSGEKIVRVQEISGVVVVASDKTETEQ